METVLNYQPIEQRYLAFNPVLEVTKTAPFLKLQASVETGQGVPGALREFSLWLKSHGDAVLRLFVTSPPITRLEVEGLPLDRLRLVGTQIGFRQRIRLYLTPSEALELADSPDYVLYAADVPLRALHPDAVTLDELRRRSNEFATQGGQIGASLADSLIFAGCACVFADIPPHMISIYHEE